MNDPIIIFRRSRTKFPKKTSSHRTLNKFMRMQAVQSLRADLIQFQFKSNFHTRLESSYRQVRAIIWEIYFIINCEISDRLPFNRDTEDEDLPPFLLRCTNGMRQKCAPSLNNAVARASSETDYVLSPNSCFSTTKKSNFL